MQKPDDKGDDDAMQQVKGIRGISSGLQQLDPWPIGGIRLRQQDILPSRRSASGAGPIAIVPDVLFLLPDILRFGEVGLWVARAISNRFDIARVRDRWFTLIFDYRKP